MAPKRPTRQTRAQSKAKRMETQSKAEHTSSTEEEDPAEMSASKRQRRGEPETAPKSPLTPTRNQAEASRGGTPDLAALSTKGREGTETSTKPLSFSEDARPHLGTMTPIPSETPLGDVQCNFEGLHRDVRELKDLVQTLVRKTEMVEKELAGLKWHRKRFGRDIFFGLRLAALPRPPSHTSASGRPAGPPAQHPPTAIGPCLHTPAGGDPDVVFELLDLMSLAFDPAPRT
ncbi:hypothetical protein CDD83_9038 [Cordyceps sp. RAO-2017]|nr:hypothetical protein CDD83_9038 [Cordyceps sp. RAO-2017]